MDIAITGGGICGLSPALNLQRRGLVCRVYERAPDIKELGVRITLLHLQINESAGSLSRIARRSKECTQLRIGLLRRFLGQIMSARERPAAANVGRV